jgi:DNA processing protein
MSDRAFIWTCIARAPGFHAAHLHALTTTQGSLDAALLAIAGPDRTALAAAGLRPRAIESLVVSLGRRADAALAWFDDPNHCIVDATSPRYPPLLAEQPGAPPVLFVRGDPACLGLPQLAMVGSRNPTAGGRETAHDFARHFASVGLAITSGLALGIDAACHEGALAAEGITLAVCANGLDRIYPADHRELATRIARSGALVSEFAPGSPPLARNFPQRNRLIAGLSLGTLVVEAAPRSGSLITARLAGEAGREVFAIPGSIHNPLSRGCHALIRQGAKLVESAADVLSELQISISKQHFNAAAVPATPASRPGRVLDKAQKILLDALAFEPTSLDRLIERTGQSSESVAATLLILELEGLVQSLPGGRYIQSGTAVQ